MDYGKNHSVYNPVNWTASVTNNLGDVVMSMDAVHGVSSLKLEVVSLLEFSGFKEFQSATVHGEKLYLNTSDLAAGGMKW